MKLQEVLERGKPKLQDPMHAVYAVFHVRRADELFHRTVFDAPRYDLGNGRLRFVFDAPWDCEVVDVIVNSGHLNSVQANRFLAMPLTQGDGVVIDYDSITNTIQ